MLKIVLKAGIMLQVNWNETILLPCESEVSEIVSMTIKSFVYIECKSGLIMNAECILPIFRFIQYQNGFGKQKRIRTLKEKLHRTR